MAEAFPGQFDYPGKLKMILDHAKTHPDFDSEFPEIMADKLAKGEVLTPNMKKALDRIYSRVIKQHFYERRP